MTIANQIQRIKTNITNAYQEIEKFNVNVSEYNNKSDKLAQAISLITVGETINNQNKTITENGTYSADEGYTGLGEVVVNVPTSSELPSGFTKYDYLEKTTAGQYYIDTFYVPTNNTKIYIDWLHTKKTTFSGTSMFGWVLGVRNTKISSYPTFGLTAASATGALYGTCWSKNFTSSSIIELNTRYNAEMSTSDGLYLNGTKLGDIEDSTFTAPASMYLFGCYFYGAATANQPTTAWMLGRIYACKIYESGELVRDLIPVKRNDNGMFGLYDNVTGCFFSVSNNAGFTVGNENTGGAGGGAGGEQPMD